MQTLGQISCVRIVLVKGSSLRNSALFELFYELITDVYRYRSFVPERLDNLYQAEGVPNQCPVSLSSNLKFGRAHLLGAVKVQDTFLVFRHHQADQLDYVPPKQCCVRKVRSRRR